MIGVLTAATAAGAAVALSTRSGSAVPVRRRLGLGRSGSVGRTGRMRLLVPAVSLVFGALAFMVLGDRPHLVLVAIAVGGVAYAGGALRRKTRLREMRHRRQAEAVDICDAIVSELSAGSPPSRALAHVARDWPMLGPAARTAELGGEVPDALRALSNEPGRGSFRQIAAAWQVSLRSGAGLAGVLDRLSAAMRSDDEARQEVIASLGAPRATARVLAVLPAFGLALGAGIGGDPVGVLLETMLGAVCLLLGSVLAVAGLFWVEHIADTAELV